MAGKNFQFFKAFPEDPISKAWDKEELIYSLAYGEGKWVLITDPSSPYSGQRWSTRTEFPKDVISTGWNDGLDISWIGYGEGVWFVVMSGNTGIEDQRWITNGDFRLARLKKLLRRESQFYSWFTETIDGPQCLGRPNIMDSKFSAFTVIFLQKP